MSTVTVEQYQFHTGDVTTASATVQANLDIAEQMVEDYLRRSLASTERTERMRVWPHGLVYPANVPVTSVQASADYSVHNEATIKYVTADDGVESIVGPDHSVPVDGYPHSLPYASVTYVGGWTAASMPVSIVRVVSLAARAFANPSSIPASGVASAGVGDVNITYSTAAGDTNEAIDAIVPLASTMLSGYRWRPR